MTTSTYPVTLDPRPALAEVTGVAAGVIAAIRADQLDLPTPTDMSVRELLEHCTRGVRRIGAAGRGEHPSTWPVDAPDVRDGGWSEAWAAGVVDATAAWSNDATLARDTALPWGVTSGAEALAVYVNETLIHSWDLAQATGQTPTWTEATIAIADTAMHAQLPMADRDPMWAEMRKYIPDAEAPFANAVDVAADAPALDRLIAWNGRQP